MLSKALLFFFRRGTINGSVEQPSGAVSCLETSFIFETCLLNLGKINSNVFLVARTARGAARTKTWKLLIRNRGSSLHYCQVVGLESSPLDKRELWNGVSIEYVSE